MRVLASCVVVAALVIALGQQVEAGKPAVVASTTASADPAGVLHSRRLLRKSQDDLVRPSPAEQRVPSPQADEAEHGSEPEDGPHHHGAGEIPKQQTEPPAGAKPADAPVTGGGHGRGKGGSSGSDDPTPSPAAALATPSPADAATPTTPSPVESSPEDASGKGRGRGGGRGGGDAPAPTPSPKAEGEAPEPGHATGVPSPSKASGKGKGKGGKAKPSPAPKPSGKKGRGGKDGRRLA